MRDNHQVLMVVEDVKQTIRALRRVFTRYAWDVRPATTVAESADLLNAGLEPDYLILDLNLPDGNDEVVLCTVREAGLATQVIIFSGDCDALRSLRVHELRPGLILIKPLDPEVMFNLCDGSTHPGSNAL